jgi:hypothetical protein
MLSLIACYGWAPALVVIGVWSEGRLDGDPLPRLRPRLWGFVVVVAVLAIDFALVRRIAPPVGGWHLYLSDAAVVLVPLLVGTLTRRSLGELWSLGTIVGLIGLLTTPSISMS